MLAKLYVVGALIAWVLNTGMIYADVERDEGGFLPSRARQELGLAVVIGGMGAVVWPIATPTIWCVTGFAYHGLRFR